MARFWNRSKKFEESLETDSPNKPEIGTYRDFSESEIKFILDTSDQITKSDEWFETQKQFIAWVRAIELDKFPGFKDYANLKDWELAYLMDTLLICDLEVAGQRFDTVDFQVEFNSDTFTLISMIYAGRVVEAFPDEREVLVKTSQDLIKNAQENGTLTIQGSMFRWIN